MSSSYNPHTPELQKCMSCSSFISPDHSFCPVCKFPLKGTQQEQDNFFYHRGYKQEQLKELKNKGYDVFVNLCEGYLEWDIPSIDVIYTLELLNLSALPEWMTHFGQLFIGISLGTRFTPEFLHTAPRYLASVALCALLAILVAGGFGLLLAWVSGINPATAILATSPCGIEKLYVRAADTKMKVRQGIERHDGEAEERPGNVPRKRIGQKVKHSTSNMFPIVCIIWRYVEG